ncbi:helix-turn-helix domain-containing protein [Patescibacteria group bacterium]|nr:helix-turn-helix domain-containing protein [Patescibacteria group bacterium]
MHTEESKFYTSQELSKVLKVNIMTIYRYIKAGKLQAYKIGKEYRIAETEFTRFLNEASTE